VALTDRGLRAATQVPLEVRFRGQVVGEFAADLLVEGKVAVELKAVKALAPEHQAQLINYLNATQTDVGLLASFGNPQLEYKRCYRGLQSRGAVT